MICTYLLEAYTEGYDPLSDPQHELADERVAAYRLFLHEAALSIVPTVSGEIEAIPKLKAREAHIALRDVHLVEILGLDEGAVQKRTEELLRYHPKEKDCRIVAEAELGGLMILLTFDRELLKNLGGKTQLYLVSPSERWRQLQIPYGTPPQWAPHPSNPLYKALWWRWDSPYGY